MQIRLKPTYKIFLKWIKWNSCFRNKLTSKIYLVNAWKCYSFCKNLQVIMISSTEENGTVKQRRFLQGDIENENQVALLVGNYKKPTRGM